MNFLSQVPFEGMESIEEVVFNKETFTPFIGKVVALTYQPANLEAAKLVGVIKTVGETSFMFQRSPTAGTGSMTMGLSYQNVKDIQLVVSEPVNGSEKNMQPVHAGLQMQPWMWAAGVGLIAYFLGRRSK